MSGFDAAGRSGWCPVEWEPPTYDGESGAEWHFCQLPIDHEGGHECRCGAENQKRRTDG